MALANDSLSTNAMGGTELLKHELVRRIERQSPGLLDEFQIFVSRVHEPINKDKIVIYWLHDTAEDPAAAEELKNGRWQRFDFLVFVSHWQMNQYMMRHSIPFQKCCVMENCIQRMDAVPKDYSDKIRLIYTPTPHRGLQILVPVFKALTNKYPDKLELDVFSSFKLYGWEERDAQYAELFDECRNTPGINYHGSVPNDRVREALGSAHIFAYPSIWPETSCLCLIEAMAAGLVCVHPNYGALPDTAGGLTAMYQWSEDPNEHAQRFFDNMCSVIDHIQEGNSANLSTSLAFQRMYAGVRFDWDVRESAWLNFLTSLSENKLALANRRPPDPAENFVFRIP